VAFGACFMPIGWGLFWKKLIKWCWVNLETVKNKCGADAGLNEFFAY